MTNREKLKELFPYLNIVGTVFTDKRTEQVLAASVNFNWLDAEYKEPTIRNCFGCKYSKDNHRAGTEECHLCMWENQYTPTTKNDSGDEYISRSELMCVLSDYYDTTIEYRSMLKEIAALPSVTPQEPILDKIRADVQNGIHHFLDGEPIIEIKEVLQILDKYRADRSKNDNT